MWRVICMVCMVLLLSESLTAQGRTLLSRAALDSLVNPALSTTAQGKLIAKDAVISLGTIKDNTRPTARFTLRNTSSSTIEITSLYSTCGCVTCAASTQSVAAGESMSIEAIFNPAGRDGDFKIDVLVYTSLDTKRPTVRLTIEGVVEPAASQPRLKVQMGELSLSRREVVLDSRTRTERIACINHSDKELRISAKPTAQLTLRCEPEVIAAGGEGDIVISLRGAMPTTELRTMLIIEGVTATPAERMIKVTIKE